MAEFLQKNIAHFLFEDRIKELRNIMGHQCYYCEQFFETKEKLYDHLEVHSEPVTKPKKKTKKKTD